MPATTPTGFTLADPGTGSRLVAEIENTGDYDEGDVLLIVNDADGVIAARGDPRIGVVNIFGLDNGTAFTGRARVLSEDVLSSLSDPAAATPTDVTPFVEPDFNVFKRVKVSFDMSGGSLIEWQMNGAKLQFPLTFFVQFSHTADLQGDHWSDVTSVVDGCFAVDPAKRLFAGMNQLAYYRVIAREPNGTEHVSPVQQAIGRASRHDFLIARDVFRKEALRLRKFVGVKGYLRKVRQFGERCPDCIDQDTDEVTNSDCPVCYGTGIAGGYHEPVEFYVELGLKARTLDNDVNYGAVQNVAQQCRCMGCPELSEGDLWIREDTDERYFVREVRDAAHLAVPVVVIANFRKVPIDDPAYKVPRP